MNKVLLFILTIALCSCSGSSEKKGVPLGTPKERLYENDFFSIKYPYNWTYDEEVNNISDSISAMSKGIRCTLYNPNSEVYSTISVQKSAMFECFKTPEEWRNLSIELKQFDDHYIGTVESYMLDSLTFGPYPASMAGFVVATDEGDTLIHKQMVIMDGKDLYYLNNIFDWNDDGTLEKRGDSILTTMRLKGKKEL